MRLHKLIYGLIPFALVSVGTTSYAEFEYRCLRSGMTKLEFHQACQTETIVTQLQNVVRNASLGLTRSIRTPESLENFIPFCRTSIRSGANLANCLDYSAFNGTPLAGSLADISLDWTRDEFLWRVRLRYLVPFNTLDLLALRRALMERFPEKEIQETFIRDYEWFDIVLIGHEVSDAAIEEITEEYLPNL